MTGDVVPAPQQGGPAAAAAPAPGDPMDVECPICYQEYNQFNKCPRVLECHHVFCSECLQRIQLSRFNPPDPHSPPAIPCPLCRHLTPLASGDPLSLPSNSRVLARLPPLAFRLPVTMATGLATVTQRVVVSLGGENRDTRFIILPTVSLRVQQMHPERPFSIAAGLVSEEDEVLEQSKKTLFCVQLLAIIFWVLFVITCVVGVVFGPHFLNKKL